MCVKNHHGVLSSATFALWFLMAAWIFAAHPQGVPGQAVSGKDALSHKLSFLWFTAATSVIIFTERVTSMSPVDKLIREIRASNKTAEQKFQQVVLLQQTRYCGSIRTCSNVNLGICGFCRPCQCDDNCLQYGDCCPDKLFQNVKEVQPLSLGLSCRDNLYAGYTDMQRQSRLANATSFFMMDSCPASSSLAATCQDESNYLPVSVPAHQQPDLVQVFANKYCAQCHGVQSDSMLTWKLMAHCGSVKNFTSVRGNGQVHEAAQEHDCFLLYHPPPSVPLPRQCYYDNAMVSSCNVSGTWLQGDNFTERACAAYLSPKEAEGKVFQNVFCYICNSPDPELFNICKRVPVLDPMPFSALLDFSDAIYGRSAFEVTSKCPDSHIYDDTTGHCRFVLCAPRRHYMDGYCPVIFSSARGLGYALYFSVLMDDDLDLYDSSDLLHVIPGTLEFILIRLMLGGRDTVRATQFEVSFDVTNQEGRCWQKSRLFSVFCTFIVSGDVDQDEFEQKLLDIRNTTLTSPWGYGTRYNYTTHVDEHAWQAEQIRSESRASRACSTTVATHHELLEGDEEVVYTRVNHLLKLPKVALERSEYYVHTSDLSLQVPWLPDAIPLERYHSTTDGTVYVALSDFQPKLSAYRSASHEADEAEVTLSIVCTALSLIGLTLTFMTYAVFRSLRTVPGKNNMNLCLTLFLAQFFYLIGSGRTEVPGLCQAMGILIHYFWLSAFAAMSVCSYHMWRVFTCFKAADDDNDQRRRFLQYTVYIWGSAALAVVVTLLAHIIATGGEEIGYGGRQCYLSSALGIAIGLGVPVAVTITVSIVFFSLTVRTIRSSPKLSKSKQDERHVWVYFKLSTLTGVTWALAFIVFFTEVTVLRYIFTIVNSLQGLFICISFVFNSRVAKLCQSCCKQTHPQLTPTTSGTDTTCANNTVSCLRYKNETSFTDVTNVYT